MLKFIVKNTLYKLIIQNRNCSNNYLSHRIIDRFPRVLKNIIFKPVLTILTKLVLIFINSYFNIRWILSVIRCYTWKKASTGKRQLTQVLTNDSWLTSSFLFSRVKTKSLSDSCRLCCINDFSSFLSSHLSWQL